VGSVSIQLDDHALSPPEEIDSERANAHIHLGLGKAASAAGCAEPGLKLTPSAVWPELVGDRQSQILRLTQRSSELRLGKCAPEIGERSGRRRDRDIEAASGLGGVESA
jgi:hypothetical protein